MSNQNEIWNNVIDKLTAQVPSSSLNAWFSRVYLEKISNDVAVINCADTFARDWVEGKYKPLIKTALQDVTGKSVKLAFIVGGQAFGKDVNPMLPVSNSPLFNSYTKAVVDKAVQSNLNNRYTFETFIVGQSNRLAHAAAEAVAARLGSAYNPLFIYGGVGLGKTHLMQSIGNRVMQQDPDKKVYYCASETFLNEMVEAIRGGKTSQFREKYRQLDLLVIDDIQFVSNWQETQNEIFHTFNELYLANKQIVFASDRHPSEIPNLMERLRSRFEGGMVADISEPTFETRVAILKKKSEQMVIHLPDEVLVTIAQYVESNIRELEGALNKIYNQKTVMGTIPSPTEVQEMLKKDLEVKRKKVSPALIIKEVAREFNVSTTQLKGTSRSAQISIPRQVAMYIIREDLQYKLEDVAKILNRKDHTTVLSAVKKVSLIVQKDSAVRDRMERVRRLVKRGMAG